MGNNSKVEAKGIGICKLFMSGGRTIFLHDVLYAPDIQQNLIYVTVLLNLDYILTFKQNGLDIYLNSVLMGTGFLLDSFMVLDIDLGSY